MKYLNLTCFFLVSIIILISCNVSYLNKDIDDNLAWDGSVQLPLGYINYTASEIFQDLGNDDFDPTSSEELRFFYTESFSGVDDNSFNIQIPPTSISSQIQTPVNLSDVSPYTYPFTLISVPDELKGKTVNDQVVYDLNLKQEMTGVSFDGGMLQLTVTSSFDAEVSLTMKIPSLTKNVDGTTFSKNFILERTSNESITIDLKEYNADFTHDGTEFYMTTNTLVVNIEATIEFFAGSILDTTDMISYELVLSNATTEVVYGDFKQESFSVPEKSISFDFLDGDNISFSNPQMDLSATSDYGFPIAIDLSGVKALKDGTLTELNYSGDQSLNNTLIIEGVTNYGDEPKVTTRSLDKTNSNIDMLIEKVPTEIQLDMNGFVNPFNSNPNKNFYARSNEGLNLELTIRFDDFSLTQQIEFENGDDLDEINSFDLMVSVENKIPLTGNIEMRFIDPSGHTVHTETLNVFNAANVISSGESDGQAVLSDFEIQLDQAEISEILTATDIVVKVTLEPPSGKNKVILKGSDELSISIGAVISGEILSQDD